MNTSEFASLYICCGALVFAAPAPLPSDRLLSHCSLLHLACVALCRWGVAKGKLAQLESEKMSLQADYNVMETVAAGMKGALVKGGLVKKLVLDRMEQAVFDRLEAGS